MGTQREGVRAPEPGRRAQSQFIVDREFLGNVTGLLGTIESADLARAE